MELGRNFIERRDFSMVRQGYDPDEVEHYLEQVAAAVARLRAEARRGSLGTSTASKVQSVLDEAEQSAAQIRAEARRWAQETGDMAKKHSEETLRSAKMAGRKHYQDADAQLTPSLHSAQSAAAKLRQRCSNTEWKVDQMVEDASTVAQEAQGLQPASGRYRQALEAACSKFAELCGSSELSSSGSEQDDSAAGNTRRRDAKP